MVKLLDDDVNEQIKILFDAQLVYPVELLYFSDKYQCKTCDETKQLLEEITSLSDKLQLCTYDIKENPLLARKYNVTLAPGLVILGRNQDELVDYGIHFAGIPSGYEFSSLLHAIKLVSKRDSGLKPEVRKELKDIKTPIDMKIFVTPT